MSTFPSISESLAPKLQEFEARRKKCVKTFHICNAIILAIVVAVIAVIASFQPNDGGVYIFPAFIGLMLVGVAYFFSTNSYRSSFKENIVRQVIESYMEGIQYDPTGSVNRGYYTLSKLFLKRVDRYKGEDFVKGKKDKTEFEFSELHTQYKTTTRTKNGTRTTYHTIFKGVFFVADFNKDFQGRTFVLPDTAEGMLGKFGQKLQSMNFSRPDLVKLEDPEFEKEFCVYSDDQVEARYILSTSLMRRILEYKRKFGNRIHLSFYQSKLYVALSTSKNHFEPQSLLFFAGSRANRFLFGRSRSTHRHRRRPQPQPPHLDQAIDFIFGSGIHLRFRQYSHFDQ